MRPIADHARFQGDTPEDYFMASARREVACITQLRRFPRPQGLCYGPRQYRPNAASKLSTLANYMKVAPYLLPQNKTFRASIMWHGDLHTNNIFVHPEKPTQITGIIDWQSVQLSPLFMQLGHPSIVDFDGSRLEGYAPPNLPDNFDELSPEEQTAAKKLRAAQSLHKLYEIAVRQRDEQLFRAMLYRKTVACQTTGLVGSLFRDGEPYVDGLLLMAEREWARVVRSGDPNALVPPCPLRFSAEDKERQDVEVTKWIEGIELMGTVLEEVGAQIGWNGWVNHADYESTKARLDGCLERFLSREARNEEERVAWLKAWPFQDNWESGNYTIPP
jgi:hypothetical protein